MNNTDKSAELAELRKKLKAAEALIKSMEAQAAKKEKRLEEKLKRLEEKFEKKYRKLEEKNKALLSENEALKFSSKLSGEALCESLKELSQHLADIPEFTLAELQARITDYVRLRSFTRRTMPLWQFLLTRNKTEKSSLFDVPVASDADSSASEEEASEKDASNEDPVFDQIKDTQVNLETAKGILAREKAHANALDLVDKAALQVSESGEAPSPVSQAMADIAAHPSPKRPPEEKAPKQGRRRPDNKKAGNAKQASGDKGWICPNCKTFHPSELARAIPGEYWEAFFRIMGESFSSMVQEMHRAYPICNCNKCSKGKHVALPLNEPLQYSAAPGCSYADNVVISFGIAPTLGIPINAFTKLFSVSDKDIGTDSLARAAHTWSFSDPTVPVEALTPFGIGGLLALQLRKAAQNAAIVELDEKPFEVRQHNGKAQVKAASASKQAYVLVKTSVPGADLKFTIYEAMDGRSSKAIAALLKGDKFEAAVTDAYGGYLSVFGKLLDRPDIKHGSCLTHWRRKMLNCVRIEEFTDLLETKDGFEIAKKKIKENTPEYLICSSISALRKVYRYEHTVERRENETYEAFLVRVQDCRTKHALPLMNKIDVIMEELAKTHAEKRVSKSSSDDQKDEEPKRDRWVSAKQTSSIADAVVYYLNNREELRYFLVDPRAPADTNLCERKIRPLNAYMRSSGGKQSFKYLQSYANMMTLTQTAMDNGIEHPEVWLTEFHRAFMQHAIDWTLTFQKSEALRIHRFLPGAITSFDWELWMPWNYAKRMKLGK